MAIKNVVEMSCDLCKHPPEQFRDLHEAQMLGWIVVRHESHYGERTSFDSHLCPKCVEKIQTKLPTVL